MEDYQAYEHRMLEPVRQQLKSKGVKFKDDNGGLVIAANDKFSMTVWYNDQQFKCMVDLRLGTMPVQDNAKDAEGICRVIDKMLAQAPGWYDEAKEELKSM